MRRTNILLEYRIKKLILGKPRTWKFLLYELKIPKGTLNRYLRILEERGEVERVVDDSPSKIAYKLTETGEDTLDSIEGYHEAEASSRLEGYDIETVENLVDYFQAKFRRMLLHQVDLVDLGVKDFLMTFGIYPMAVLARNVIAPTSEAKKYLGFLAKTYVYTVDEDAFKGMPSSSWPAVVESLWRLASPELIGKPLEEMREKIFDVWFDFSKGYAKSLNEVEGARGILKKHERDKNKIFARLKLASHPLNERKYLVKRLWELVES